MATSPITSGRALYAGFMLTESNITRLEGVVTLAANSVAESGQIMKQDGTTKKWTPFVNGDALTGLVGVLYEKRRNQTGAPVDKKAVLFVKNAEVIRGLLLPANFNATIETALGGQGVVVRGTYTS